MILKVLLIVLLVLAIVLAILYFLGRRTQKKQAEVNEQIEAMKQTVSMLIIDKKKLPLKQSGLPQAVIDQTPWYARRGKMPIVKAKVGPRIMNLVADQQVFDLLPVKAEVKVEISGIYITAIKSVRGGTIKQPEKQGWLARLRKRVSANPDK
ncbi:MAG: hypothetical protein IKD62_03160 [Oscillospiraceae bacterium]|nr:hypothetical protein [Oscillospiraceae bacterium]